ncbi:Putative fluoride ion transporter CrcB [Frondihabitans sp. 762G35]|uniref:fluoride efflux transporter FluC n=1 Tax=Frondihabitans sp. 762G35 TaxID=1446794 RepID=UPI000D2009D3|nr:CrcB family protein [Frondihabitans sp. 762G35]ARC58471.1 Putative fluoride ion transporter CrcB [Frondihabitans sp. 762G35]
MRPAHRRPRLILLVALGGALGTALREALALTWPAPAGGFPLTIFLINVVGAFALGFLLEALSHGGPDEGRRREVRLFVGTGVLGGFTTYSALATDTATLLGGPSAVGVAYGVVSVAAGFLTALLGVALAARLAHRRNRGAR